VKRIYALVLCLLPALLLLPPAQAVTSAPRVEWRYFLPFFDPSTAPGYGLELTNLGTLPASGTITLYAGLDTNVQPGLALTFDSIAPLNTETIFATDLELTGDFQGYAEIVSSQPLFPAVISTDGRFHVVYARNFDFTSVATAQAAETDHDHGIQVPGKVYSITVNLGDTVSWIRLDGFHNVVADDKESFDSGPASSDWRVFNHTFTTAGQFTYYCSLHGSSGGSGMAGVVNVVDPSAPVPTQQIYLPYLFR
jgi:plastocyanin